MQRNAAVAVLIVAIGLVGGCASDGSGALPAVEPGTSDPIAALSVSRLPAVRGVARWESKYGDGLIITTEHYTIRTTLTDPLILRLLPTFLESAYEGYQRELPERISTQNTFEVYLFARREEWEAFTDDFVDYDAAVYKKIQKGAYCLKGACVAYYIGRNETYSAIGHEGWHQFCGRHFMYRLPSWLDEGIATLFETSSYRNGRWVFEPQMNLGRLGGLKRTILDGKMVPLRQLLGLNPGEVIGGQSSTVAFYAQSYALVRFLREEGYGKRLGQYHALLLGGLHGQWSLPEELQTAAADRNVRLTVRWNSYVGPVLFEQYITPDLGLIEEEYLNYCRKITYHVRLRQVEVPVTVDEDG